jgi:endo-1,3(4)-beta-glucanase
MRCHSQALSKFAMVCFVAKEIVRDQGLANTCISKLKGAFNRFSSNSQIFPLVYDGKRFLRFLFERGLC